MEQHYKNTTDNYSLQDLGLKCSAWKRLCLKYPKMMQIIQNLAEIEALPKCIRNSKSIFCQNPVSSLEGVCNGAEGVLKVSEDFPKIFF